MSAVLHSLCLTLAFLAPPAGALSRVDAAADVLHLRALVEREWSYLDLRSDEGLSLDALEREALASLTAEMEPAAFARVLRRFVAALQDGHSSVHAPGAAAPRRLPVLLADVVEGVIVHGVHAPSVGEQVTPGDVVLAIGGEDVEAALARAGREVFASTPGARRRHALGHLSRHAEAETVTLRLRSPDGMERSVVVACPPADTVVGARLLPLWRREARRVDDAIGYFRPASFSWPKDSGWASAPPEARDGILAGEYAALEQALAALADVEVLILDLRGNPGGTDLLGQKLAEMLIDGPFVYYRLQGRDDDGDWRPVVDVELRGARTGPSFLGPLICLIDEGTFSVADNLAACLAGEHPDVTFVGRPTGGGTGAPRAFTLPRSGARVSWCTMRVFAPDGALIEGRGTTPDVPVRASAADILAGRDADLEAALAIARERIAER